MSDNDYFPYLCRDDAVQEYNSLRNEIIESQKQRVSLLQYSLILLGALFGYLLKDRRFSPEGAFFLIILTIPPSLFSYSTRCRERRIANYLTVFMEKLTPWSALSSSSPKLRFFQRSSTAMVVLMLLLDIVFLVSSWPFPSLSTATLDFRSIPKEQVMWVIALIITLLNFLIVWKTAKLPNYKLEFQRTYDKWMKKPSSAEQQHQPNAD